MIFRFNKNNYSRLLQIYKQRCQSESFSYDQKQVDILAKLSDLEEQVRNNKFSFFRKPKKQGIYLYGSVGSGKSMLMDLFFSTIDDIPKERIHFHHFMENIHNEIHLHRKRKNKRSKPPLEEIAKNISRNIKLLCFDEFQVNDVADALILGQLFSLLFEYKVFVIATSNRHLDDLYKGGIQREKFLEFVDLFKEKLEVVQLSSNNDYRVNSSSELLDRIYLFPDINENKKLFSKSFNDAISNSKTTSKIIHHKAREIRIECCFSNVAKIPFSALFEEALNASDYQVITSHFSTIFVSGIRSISNEETNIAKRFINFIDICYENKTKLVFLASCQVEEIYNDGKLKFEFERTISRIKEMQSSKYLNSLK